jgi:hypothetical protein
MCWMYICQRLITYPDVWTFHLGSQSFNAEPACCTLQLFIPLHSCIQNLETSRVNSMLMMMAMFMIFIFHFNPRHHLSCKSMHENEMSNLMVDMFQICQSFGYFERNFWHHKYVIFCEFHRKPMLTTTSFFFFFFFVGWLHMTP